MRDNIHRRPHLVVASLVNTSSFKAEKILERFGTLCEEYNVTSPDIKGKMLHEMSPLEQVLEAIRGRATNFVRVPRSIVTTIDDQYCAVLQSDNIEAALKNESCDMPTRKAAALLRQAILEIVPPAPDLNKTDRIIG